MDLCSLGVPNGCVGWLYIGIKWVDDIFALSISLNSADSWQIPQYSPPVSRSSEMKTI
jgi:hypothetical protein